VVLGLGEAMRRRDFIKAVAGSAMTWPLAAHAQQPAMPVVGFLGSRSPDDSADLVAAFRAGLSETSFVENRNVIIEYRWAEDQYDRLPMLAADLVAHQVAAIAAAGGNPAGLAAKAATTKIPIKLPRDELRLVSLVARDANSVRSASPAPVVH
jgi:putative ABC transport system substrate-binding protein